MHAFDFTIIVEFEPVHIVGMGGLVRCFDGTSFTCVRGMIGTIEDRGGRRLVERLEIDGECSARANLSKPFTPIDILLDSRHVLECLALGAERGAYKWHAGE